MHLFSEKAHLLKHFKILWFTKPKIKEKKKKNKTCLKAEFKWLHSL